MLPGINDNHANHAAPTRPHAATKFSPASRSPTTITTVAVPDGIYNPPPASAANAEKPGPAAIGGEVRDMMELMHRRDHAAFASTDAAMVDRAEHDRQVLSGMEAERRRRLDMEAEYKQKHELGLLDHSGLGANFVTSSGSSSASSGVSHHAGDDAAPAAAGDGTLRRVKEFRIASTAAAEDAAAAAPPPPTATAHPPAARVNKGRVVPLPPAPTASQAPAPAVPAPVAAKPAVANRQPGKKQKTPSGPPPVTAADLVEQPDATAASKLRQQVVGDHFTLRPHQAEDVDLRSPQMADPNEVIILPPGPFFSAAAIAPYRRGRE